MVRAFCIFVTMHHILLKAMATSFRKQMEIQISTCLYLWPHSEDRNPVTRKMNQTCSLLQSDQLSPKTTALEHSMRKAWTCEVACSSFRLILTKGSHWSKPAGDPCLYLSQRGHTVIPEPQIEFRADTELQIGKYRVTIKRVIHWAMKVCLLFPQSL